MNDLDTKIRAALQSAAPDEEPNLAEEVIGVFRGRNRWMHGIVVVVSLVLLAVGVWASVRFYHAAAVREQLLWAGLALLAMLMISFMKVWLWLEMHTNRILREVKRVELLLVSRGPAN
jgi:phosphatidylserine synthase